MWNERRVHLEPSPSPSSFQVVPGVFDMLFLLRRALLRPVVAGAALSTRWAAEHSTCTKSKHEIAEDAKQEAARAKQYEEAMAWCIAENKSP